MIITDDVAPSPILDFEAYSNTIVKMIKNSRPKFSIGIYGEWGSGKTTLMKAVEDKLNQDNENKDILTIWFNAWRYEREEQFALISLLKTIAYKIDEQPKYKKVKEILFKSIIIVGKGLAAKYIFSDKYVDEFQKNFTSQMKAIAVADKGTIYFHGMKQIEDIMKTILRNSPESRIVVFIDDLDRCSPKKALEIFESIKVFLGIDGFVYVIGLSHVTISKLITAQYKESEIKGGDYIKKIIQIPIILPEWNTKDVESLIEDLLKKNLVNEDYKEIIQQNKELISEVVENNPREVKRFINNYIVAYEIYSSTNKKIDLTNLLLVQAINVRWNGFYRLMVRSTPQIREEVKKYVEMKPDTRIEQLQSEKTQEGFSPDIKRVLSDFKMDSDLWNFLKNRYDALLKIENWDDYRRAAESVKEIPTSAEEDSRIIIIELRYSLEKASFWTSEIGSHEKYDELQVLEFSNEVERAKTLLQDLLKFPIGVLDLDELEYYIRRIDQLERETDKLIERYRPHLNKTVGYRLKEIIYKLKEMGNLLAAIRLLAQDSK